MCEVIKLERVLERTPWGFRLTGGYDFGTPLSVVKVIGGSIAAQSGVQVGDIVLEINGQSTKHFIHTDAQNFIGISGNHLTLTILRGSLVTTPEVTPLRGRTPMTDVDEDETYQINFNAHVLNERLENSLKTDKNIIYDGPQKEPILYENAGLKADDINKIHTTQEGEILNPELVTDTELDELLTGNEEVLDEGILGINFKKYFPQVDFIRQSEVFKFLQNENTKKEIPEEVQLQKEPTKRFSTFLQKPKPPPPKPQGPLWHYPKAPRYLPREPVKEPEQPHRRPKRESCHTVLWLFLGETGENVIDERWGSEEEERINLSRCEVREDDTASLASSLTTAQSGRDSRLDKLDELKSVNSAREQTEINLEEKKKCIDKVEETYISQDNKYTDNENNENAVTKSGHNYMEEITEDQSQKVKSSMETSQINQSFQRLTEETIETTKKQAEKEVFSKQVADIQAQIAALEIEASSDLQTQLISIQEKLSKIVKIKSGQVTSLQEVKKDENIETREYYKNENTRVEEEEKCLAELSENVREYTFECEVDINDRKNLSEEYHASSERSSSCPENDTDSNKDDSESFKECNNENEGIKGYEKGEYEICETPVPPVKKKAPAHPITPQMRPIVLPGGRMWRQPKDACHEDFYQGILVAQADVMIGTGNGGVNFTKYIPPKFDMSHSEVYRLIHEIEDKTKALNEREKVKEYYSTPIGKRHFYAATLKEPEPVGGVDL